MVLIPCEKQNREGLEALNELAIENLTLILQACFEPCLQVWGDGNPDLAGIGVRSSYYAQIAFALIFTVPIQTWYLSWAFPLRPTTSPATSSVNAASRLSRAAKSFTFELERLKCYLQTRQNIFIWTEALFTMPVVLSATIWHYSSPTRGEYQSVVILNVVGISALSFLMSLQCCCFQEINFFPLLVLVKAVEWVCVFAAELSPLLKPERFEHLIRACDRVAGDPQTTPLAAPVRLRAFEDFKGNLPVIIANVSVSFLAEACFFVIYFRRQRLPAAAILPRGSPPKPTTFLRLLILANFVLTLCTFGFAAHYLEHVLETQWEMKNGGIDLGEEEWGVGQIGAPFVWVPLLMEVYPAAWAKDAWRWTRRSTVWGSARRRREQGASAGSFQPQGAVASSQAELGPGSFNSEASGGSWHV